MKQLSIQDAGFIYQETINTPMHISGLGFYDQAGERKKKNQADFVSFLSSRLQNANILKQKLVHVPGDWDRPYWIEDENFRLENHVNVIELPKPGNHAQLMELVSDLLSKPLDLSRPLWEVHVIEGLRSIDGLSKNSFALLTKIHHSCIDGASGNSIMEVLHDFEKNPKPVAVPTPAIEKMLTETAKRIPGHYEMQAIAYGKNVLSFFDQTTAVSRRLPSLLKTGVQLYRGQKSAGAKLTVPATRFNKTPSGKRVFESALFQLDDIKAIKNSVPGTTVNDVMVSIVAGGLRKYLAHYGELPEGSLGAMLPQNTRKEVVAKSDHGNQVGGLFANIHTNIADPIERLNAIHQSTVEAKQFAEDEGTASILPNMMGGFLYPRYGKAMTQFLQKHNLMERVGPVVVNTVITNVPGPNFPLYHAGAKLMSYSGIAPLTDGLGISHAVYSFCGKLTLSMVSCEEMMRDPEFYINCCKEVFHELCQATQVTPADSEDLMRETA